VSYQFQAAATPIPDVSLIIPVFNESDRIGHCLERLTSWSVTRTESFEIVVVDDGSTDDTALIAERWTTSFPVITVLREPHRGKASTVLAGLAFAHGRIVGFLDVDLATPIEAWDATADAFRRGADLVIASREGSGANRIGEPWYRHAMGRAFNGLIRLTLLPGIHDTQCGFKFFSQAALGTILPRTHLYRQSAPVTRARVTAFDVELLYIARSHDLNLAIVPVTWTYGEHTKVNPFTDTLQNVRDVLQVRINGWLGRYR
jgi:glycosyltransferase involved in cell wall biosynthesis